MTFTATLDGRFSEATEPADWTVIHEVLTTAELYWLTTVRADGRPHVTPLVGLWIDDSFVFCTGPAEQKARNLEHSAAVAAIRGHDGEAAGERRRVAGGRRANRRRDAAVEAAATLHQQAPVPVVGQRDREADSVRLPVDARAAIDDGIDAAVRRQRPGGGRARRRRRRTGRHVLRLHLGQGVAGELQRGQRRARNRR